MKKIILIASLLMASGLWAKSLDGTYLCEGAIHNDGSGDIADSSVMEIKGKIVKDRDTISERIYERIYEYERFFDYGGKKNNKNYKLFVYFDTVIMITKTENKRDINVSSMEPRKHSKKNYVWEKHCKKI